MPEISEPTPEALQRAADTLRRGGLVAFPTETVYGLGADAADAAAVAALYRVKRRPRSHPLIVHLAAAEQLAGWAEAVPPAAQALMVDFWPGPLTLILPAGPRAGRWLTGGQSTVAVRVPAHPVARALLEAFGGAIAAPSANRFGRISPTRAEHVAEDFSDLVEPLLVLDGGASEIGLESTIVDLSRGEPALLRPGSITPAQIAAVIGATPAGASADSPRSPGRLPSHYAPHTPTELHTPRTLERALRRSGRLGVLAITAAPRDHIAAWRTLPADAGSAAKVLYSHLRALDRSGVEAILIEAPPPGSDWDAVRDRLRKAAAPRMPAEHPLAARESRAGNGATIAEEER